MIFDYYKLKKLGKDESHRSDILLSYDEGELVGISENTTLRISEDNEEYLDDIIQRINHVFGICLTEEYKIIINITKNCLK